MVVQGEDRSKRSREEKWGEGRETGGRKQSVDVTVIVTEDD